MNKEFIAALNDLEKEKNISKDKLLETIELALLSAYKKNYGTAQNVRVVIDRETGDIQVLMRKDVVDEDDYYDDMLEIPISAAHEIDPRYEIGDSIEFSVMPKDFGRIAAQTAKQVVVQQIREIERDMVYDEFSTRQGEILTGTVQRRSGNTLYVSLGSTEGILPGKEQVPNEHFDIRDRLKVYIMDVKKANKGPQVFLSRSHPGLVKGLFEMEVPEIQDGIVEIRGTAREAGSRTKMAVFSNDPEVDPVGACVGTRGSRVQTVVDELSGEKIDIINWSDDPQQLIKNVLSPADVEQVVIEDSETKSATAVVPDDQLSLAIGKQGQNVRLAAKVSGWKIDIQSHNQFLDRLQREAEEAQMAQEEPDEADELQAAAETADENAAAPEEEVQIPADAEETEAPASEEEAAAELSEEETAADPEDAEAETAPSDIPDEEA
ncbi:MAG: transcription termination factor NusA [Eubacterium sp.]|jgi:N utilization substance protein A|nr:transcription termination factor NusA [Eubacterium sp.]MCH4046194.1 transcription termination factor NusA [Eubacterium sp.]MCH4079289.1 transcription termination factor NusA [Eubacterium sp.]MCH4110513.1 transcription termination factor NusA [Eubacterium sp.]MCI1307883.1 transcription termination factor NusA [Eubacterium sp.]